MRRTSFQSMGCPIAGALELVGDWWTLVIMRDVLDGFTRFDELHRNLGIAPTMLTRRLRELVEAGLLERSRYDTAPPRFEYLPTQQGKDLAVVIVALYAWGVKHSAAGSDQVVLTDQDTGDTIIPVWMDKSTGRRISAMNAAFLPGPHAEDFIQERLDPQLRTIRRQRAQSPRPADQGAIE
ncbi:winged helix-turn-helix transcriptional regulator [Nocardia alni]|uniref:winged helix-turn-helix transcriptional regulator n=1 Tax=Nocardia alni TaxID=2815723 RepID=UPI001C24CD6A|nr:helix-turn-helix domain-containing protein [Nocardia alni]